MDGRVAQPFDHPDATNKVGAPLFAFCAKGGRDAACSAILTLPNPVLQTASYPPSPTTQRRRTHRSSGASVDAATRKRRVLGIRMGKFAIVALVLLLIVGLLQGRPFLTAVVGRNSQSLHIGRSGTGWSSDCKEVCSETWGRKRGDRRTGTSQALPKPCRSTDS